MDLALKIADDLFSPLNLNQKERCFVLLFFFFLEEEGVTSSYTSTENTMLKEKALLAPKVEYFAPTKIKIFSGCVCFCGSGFVLQTASWGGVTVDCHILLSQENMLQTCWLVLTGMADCGYTSTELGRKKRACPSVT